MKKYSLVIILALLFIFSFMECKNEDILLSNIVLFDKPLPTIQKYIQGKWRLQYSYGGLSVHKYIETHNSYMTINSDHIIVGDDSRGIVVDTTIVWERTDIGTNDYTYLLSCSGSKYLWPEHEIIDQIKNDTLIIRDYFSDGYSYYYTKY